MTRMADYARGAFYCVVVLGLLALVGCAHLLNRLRLAVLSACSFR